VAVADLVIGGIVVIVRVQVIAAGDLILALRSRAVAIHTVGVLGLLLDAALLASGT
jgi:hypothetical protein